MASNINLKDYYQITKPGIIYGNLFTAAAGFLFACKLHIDVKLLIATLVGLGLIIACGCVINNVIDRELDKKMDRTKSRAIIRGTISVKSATRYGIVLGLVGSLILIIFTNRLTFIVALFGLLSYLVFYGLAKRKTVYGTLIGALAGAVPPLVGYTAVTNYIDLGGVVLVLILVCWQLSHFYAISLYRKADYKAAKLPVWSVVKGDESTKFQILGFMVVFTLLSGSLFIFGYTGFTYLIAVLAVGIWWYIAAYMTKDKLSPKNWGRKVFLNSLIVIVIFSVALALGPVLP